MHRFYCPARAQPGPIALEGDEARHLARVLRMEPGETVELFDGIATAAQRARIVRLGRDRVELEPTGEVVPGPEPSRCLTLATALPKGERLDWLVEKAVEIGVAHLQPIVTERSVVDPRPTKLQRLRRAVIEASKQCGRNRLMSLAEPVPLATVLVSAPDAQRLIAHPGVGQRSAGSTASSETPVVLVIGPEGGLTEAEVAQAEAQGWQPIALGATILRIETAALVGSALILTQGD